MGVSAPLRTDPWVDVTPKTTRIPLECLVDRRETAVRESKAWEEWSKVDSVVLERACGDAPATFARRDTIDAVAKSICAFMLGVLAITGHAVVATIEERRVDRVLSVLSPIPVRLISLIATFVSQRLFKVPGKISVPDQKAGCCMNAKCLIDVDSDEVIPSALDSFNR